MAYIREESMCQFIINKYYMTNNTTLTCTLLLCTTTVYLANRSEINDYISKRLKEKKDKKEKNN